MFAVNACEMEKNGHYLTPYFDQEIDIRNTKPLLLTWIQVGFIKVFGFNELTMRLPSALAVYGSVLVLFGFLRRRVNTLFAWIAALILVTSSGYIGLHTGRTGDADALLSFFILLTLLNYADWIVDGTPKKLFLTFVFFSLCVLTKSFAGFLIIPGMVLAGVILKKREWFAIFKIRQFYYGIMLVIAVIVFIFPIRELYQPGYLDLTFGYDAGRFFYNTDFYRQGWDFYLQHLFYDRFSFWTIPFFAGTILLFRIENDTQKRLAILAVISVFTYLIIISSAVTKLVWYDMPMYPLMACLAAIPVYFVASSVRQERANYKVVLVLVILFFIPYRKIFFDSQSNKMSHGDRMVEMTSLYLHHQTKYNLEEDLTIFQYGYVGSTLCYKYMYEDQGKILKIKYTADFEKGEKVFVSNDSLKVVINSQYNLDTISVFETGIFVRIE